MWFFFQVQYICVIRSVDQKLNSCLKKFAVKCINSDCLVIFMTVVVSLNWIYHYMLFGFFLRTFSQLDTEFLEFPVRFDSEFLVRFDINFLVRFSEISKIAVSQTVKFSSLNTSQNQFMATMKLVSVFNLKLVSVFAWNVPAALTLPIEANILVAAIFACYCYINVYSLLVNTFDASKRLL